MLAWFQWLEQTPVSAAINNSTWAFAAIEAVHLLALAAIGGAVLILDLRLLGWAFTGEAAADIARSARPWLVWSLAGMVVTGILLTSSLAASKYYVNGAFRLKMYLFAAAVVYTFTIRHRVATGSPARADSLLAKGVALGSILLWSSVGILGRGIGFY